MIAELNYKEYPILLVDDEPDILETLGAFLEDTFSVEIANEPETALKMIQDKEYAVILSDQRMPKMAGSALLARASQLSPESIRVLITGYTDLDAAIEAINKGEIYRYIPKQVSSEDKEILIKQAIELYQARKERDRLQKENEHMLKKLAVQRKLSTIGYFGSRLNEWLSPILGSSERCLDKECCDQNSVREASRLKTLMQRIEEVYRQTDFDIPRLRSQAEFDDLNEVIAHSVSFAKRFVKRGIRQDWEGIQIITHLDNQLPRFRMVRGPLQIAIEELLVNAKQAIEERRLDSSSYSLEGRIELRTWHETHRGKGSVYFEVKDNGCGIAPENLEEIFKPLISFSKYSVDRAGIGLNIVEQAVAFHDGQIHVESKPGQGSTFTLEFPV